MKNKHKTKIIAAVLLTTSFCAALSACSVKNTSEETDRLVWYIPGNNKEDLDDVLEAANKIIVPKIGTELEIRFINVDRYEEIMNMKIGIKENFDLCFTGYVFPYESTVNVGGLLCLDDYIESMPKLKRALPDYAWRGAEIDGSVYAVPNMQYLLYNTAIYIPRTLAEKYITDTSQIKHITDMEPFFEKIKQNEPNYYAYNPTWGITCVYIKDKNGFPKVAVGDIYVDIDENGNYKFVPSIELDEFKEAIYKTREWYEKGYIREDVGLFSSDGNNKETAAWVAMYKPGAEGEYLANGKDVIAVSLDDGQMSSNAGTTAMTGVGRWSENPEKAVKLIELVNTDKELFNILAFGLEGKNYIKTGKNRIEPVPKDENGYFVNAAWKFGNQFLAYVLPGQSDDVWKETKKLNDNASKAEFYDFKYSTKEIEDELSRIATIYEQYDCIHNGSRSPDEYLEEFDEKLHEVGSDKVCKELLRQFNEYLSSKNN